MTWMDELKMDMVSTVEENCVVIVNMLMLEVMLMNALRKSSLIDV